MRSFNKYVRGSPTNIAVDTARLGLNLALITGVGDEHTGHFLREELKREGVDASFISRSRAVIATGTHLSNPNVERATIRALKLTRENGARSALDIDFRPNFCGFSSHSDGANCYVKSAEATQKLQFSLGLFDLIVGTKNTIAALKAVRAVKTATLVCKRGPIGANVF